MQNTSTAEPDALGRTLTIESRGDRYLVVMRGPQGEFYSSEAISFDKVAEEIAAGVHIDAATLLKVQTEMATPFIATDI